MNIKQMTESDFLTIMAENAEVYPAFHALPKEQKRAMAKGNIVTGVAETYREDGEIVGVGGIRHIGIGEAWFLTLPKNRGKKFAICPETEATIKLLRDVSENFIRVRDEQGLWRVFAESKISENFLKHLGFKPEPGTYAWVRQK